MAGSVLVISKSNPGVRESVASVYYAFLHDDAVSQMHLSTTERLAEI